MGGHPSGRFRCSLDAPRLLRLGALARMKSSVVPLPAAGRASCFELAIVRVTNMPEIDLDSVTNEETLSAVPATAPAIEEALSAIRTDSMAAPGQYLDDTVVPHGGE